MMGVQPDAARATANLLEIVPGLAAALADGERELAGRLRLPLTIAPAGSLDLDGLLRRDEAFGAVVASGLIVHRTAIGGRSTSRIIGAGDMLVPAGFQNGAAFDHEYLVDADDARIVLLEARLIRAARHIPGLIPALQLQMGEQHQRLVVQMGICQLPRVEDRLLALLWLLADSWGRVTSEGTVLPLRLTHATLGELVGAKRPTVTLALGILAERGVVAREDRGWVLTGSAPSNILPHLRAAPSVFGSATASGAPASGRQPSAREMIASTVEMLAVSHQLAAGRTRARLANAREVSGRSRRLREHIAQGRSARQGLHHEDDA